MIRYSVINNKLKREILLLKGTGCVYKKCRFCDYYLDASKDESSNFSINKQAIDKVTGKYQILEVINSGSYLELDKKTRNYLYQMLKEKNIHTLYVEMHYLYYPKVKPLIERFAKDKITLKVKLGLETFDYYEREVVFQKGIKIKDYSCLKIFDSACFLFGVKGQTKASMLLDIEKGLELFKRICINIMCENSTPIKPDLETIKIFKKEIYPFIKDNERIDILLDNNNFGVGNDE